MPHPLGYARGGPLSAACADKMGRLPHSMRPSTLQSTHKVAAGRISLVAEQAEPVWNAHGATGNCAPFCYGTANRARPGPASDVHGATMNLSVLPRQTELPHTEPRRGGTGFFVSPAEEAAEKVAYFHGSFSP